MSSFANYLFLVILFTLFGCGNNNQQEKVTREQNFGEYRSTHESDREENLEQKKAADNYIIEIKKSEVLTENINGSFINPKFTRDGKYLVFTNESYGEIWIYHVFKKTLKRVVEMPQSGFRIQISENNDDIYFRNKESLFDGNEQAYSIYRYSISKNKIESIYKTKNRISQLLVKGNSIYFLENKLPMKLNLKNKNISTKFDFPYFYVQNDLLIKASQTVDTIKYSNKDIRFISCEYSKDREAVFVLTANDGILILNLNGEIIKKIENAAYVTKLFRSNLIVFTEEKDDGLRIISSNLKFGFLNSSNKISIPNDFKNKIFNPDWSPIDNKLAYSSDNGMISILSFNIEKLTQ